MRVSAEDSMYYSPYTGNTYYVSTTSPAGFWRLKYVGPSPNFENSSGDKTLLSSIGGVWGADRKIFVFRYKDRKLFIADDVAHPDESLFKQLPLSSIIPRIDNGLLVPTNNPDIVDFFIYNNFYQENYY